MGARPKRMQPFFVLELVVVPMHDCTYASI